MNTAEFLTIAGAMVPDRVAVADPDDSCTYQELQSRVNRLAQAFQGLGVGNGQNVGVMGVNSTAFLEIYYATSTVGATFVPLNFRAKTEELVYMMNASQVNVLFISERYYPLLEEIRSTLDTVEHVYTLDFRAEGVPTFDELREQGRDEAVFTEVDDDDASLVIYTSGTTAAAQGRGAHAQDALGLRAEHPESRRSERGAGDHDGLRPALPHRRRHHHARLALRRSQARHPAAVRPPGVAADGGEREGHARLRGADDAQARDGGRRLRQLRHLLAPADHLRRCADAVRGRPQGDRYLRLRADERLRPDRIDLDHELPRPRRPPAGRHAGGERAEAGAAAFRGPARCRTWTSRSWARMERGSRRERTARSASAATV